MGGELVNGASPEGLRHSCLTPLGGVVKRPDSLDSLWLHLSMMSMIALMEPPMIGVMEPPQTADRGALRGRKGGQPFFFATPSAPPILAARRGSQGR